MLKKCAGLHRILETNPALKIAKGTIELFTGGSSQIIKTNSEDVDNNFIILSNNGTEINKIISSILPELNNLKDTFKKAEYMPSIDTMPTHFEIQIKNDSLLFRIDSVLGFLIEELYPSIEKIQKKLS